MKELSVEQKARRYDEVLEKAKSWHVDSQIDFRKSLENLLPELAESKDERIRKELIKGISKTRPNTLFLDTNVTREEALTWLEKQGDHANFLSKIQVGDKVTRNEDGVLVNLSQLKRLAKQGEQKPKFRVGDTIKCKYDDRQFTIKSVDLDKGTYTYTQEGCGNDIDYADKEFKLVEQKPADKKGMNLVEEEMTPFQKKVFCIIDTTIEEEQGLKQVCDELLALASNEIKQKSAEWSEEDEHLFHAIINSLDREKLERTWKTTNDVIGVWLNSFKNRLYLQHNQGWSEGDDNHFRMCLNIMCGSEGEYAQYLKQEAIDWFKSLKDRVQPQPKHEWSEEDEEMLNHIICDIESLKEQVYCKTLCNEEIDWLKSLKDRVQPQPKQEWSEEDEEVIKSLISYLENELGLSQIDEDRKLFKRQIEIVKSLHLQKQWKPSDEQMEAMQKALVDLCGKDEHNIITGLYYDLKKLREE